MMPLWTTARWPVAWVCALVSVGRPCVAPRVSPMPIVPVSGSRASFASRLRNLPSAKPPLFQRCDAGGIIAVVFEPLGCVDQRGRHRLTPENADNSAQASVDLLFWLAPPKYMYRPRAQEERSKYISIYHDQADAFVDSITLRELSGAPSRRSPHPHMGRLSRAAPSLKVSGRAAWPIAHIPHGCGKEDSRMRPHL